MIDVAKSAAAAAGTFAKDHPGLKVSAESSLANGLNTLYVMALCERLDALTAAVKELKP